MDRLLELSGLVVTVPSESEPSSGSVTSTASARRRPTSSTAAEPTSPTDVRWTSLAATMARAVRRQCPAWLSADADDIAQAALTKVMAVERASEGTRELTSFYLHRVAHSALVDEIRRRKRRAEVPLENTSAVGEHGSLHEPHAPDDPERQASCRELGFAVRNCLGCLARERRLAVTLHLQGHSVPEVARLLGWEAKRAENLVYRGLANLRQCLMRKGYRP